MPYTMAQEVVSIYAGVNGYLDNVKIEDVSKYEAALQESIKLEGSTILSDIEKTKDLSEDLKKRLDAFVEEFTKKFVGDDAEKNERGKEDK